MATSDSNIYIKEPEPQSQPNSTLTRPNLTRSNLTKLNLLKHNLNQLNLNQLNLNQLNLNQRILNPIQLDIKPKVESEPILQSKSCLFIQGFDTKYSDNYRELIDHLAKYYTDHTDIIKYDNDQTVGSVIGQIISKLGSKKYDLIIGHSMGGFILAKMLSLFLISVKNAETETDSDTDPDTDTIFDSDYQPQTDSIIEYNFTKTKIILLNPLLEANPFAYYITTYLPNYIHPYIYLPRLFINPTSALVENKNSFDDLLEYRSYTLVSTNIIADAHLIMLNKDDITNVFKSFYNIHLIYSTNDTICPLSQDIINLIKSHKPTNTYKLDSKHEPFNPTNPETIKKQFYGFLDKITNQIN